LFYVLASTFLLVRLVLSRLVSGVWGIDWELLAVAVVVSLAQLAALELVPALMRGTPAGKHREDGPAKADQA
jgi:hypothetical protein